MCAYFKRSHQLREILQHTWIREDPNATTDGGNTLLHSASKLGETKLVNVLLNTYHSDANIQNKDGNTALHLSVQYGFVNITESLVKNDWDLEVSNQVGLSPLQLAALKCHIPSLEILFKHKANHLVLTKRQETILHLACYSTLSKILSIKDDLRSQLENEPLENNTDLNCHNIESQAKTKEQEIQSEAFPCLEMILEKFKKNPDVLEIEDTLETSPGGILHYFACLNYVEGVKILVQEPFLISPNVLNKNHLSPLWIASWHNRTTLGQVLLEYGADPDVQDSQIGYTPLHCAILGYHIDRVTETCNFIEALLDQGANPRIMDKSGETAPHLSIGTLDFKIMSKFIDHLGSEVTDIQDETGNTLLHYAVGYLDEHSIYSLMVKGANLMSYNQTECLILDDDEFNIDQLGFQVIQIDGKIQRQKSIPIQRIPLQEAMKNGNSTAYFNALRRLSIKNTLDKMDDKDEAKKFLCMHLVAATREVRPDIVRLLFHENIFINDLHDILLFKEKYNEDDTFRKTALEWAVENNDR